MVHFHCQTTFEVTPSLMILMHSQIQVPPLHDHPFELVCPDVFSPVGDPLSGNRCGSPNRI